MPPLRIRRLTQVILGCVLLSSLSLAIGGRTLVEPPLQSKSNDRWPFATPVVLLEQQDRQTLSPERRSPIDVEFIGTVERAVVLNKASGSLSLVDIVSEKVLDEVACGTGPTQIVSIPQPLASFQERFESLTRLKESYGLVVVTATESDELCLLAVTANKLVPVASHSVSLRPYSVAIEASGTSALVSRHAAHDIVRVDLLTGAQTTFVETSSLPGFIGLSPDQTKLAVATPAERGVSTIDVQSGEVVHVDRFAGVNFGHFAMTSDSQYAYFPWMVYRRFPITVDNIQRGWVMASRLARLPLQKDSRREAMSLDPPGNAVADPWGVALNASESHVIISAGGSHELLVLPIDGLPLEARGSTDHLVSEFQDNPERMRRIELEGRPLGLAMHDNDDWVLVANDLDDALQVVDWKKGTIVKTIQLRGAHQPTPFEQGRAIFYDADRSIDAWYSCHTCHIDGGTNAITMDTANDGSFGTFKTVLPLYELDATGPWTWHGWQKDARAAMKKSLLDTMRGPKASDDDATQLLAFFSELKTPVSPHAKPNNVEMQESIARGATIFSGDLGGCANCHSGAHYTDGLIHEVGLGKDSDRYIGFNTPTLKALWLKVRFLHDGSAHSLEEVLTKYHRPDELEGSRELTEQEVEDLIAYLMTL